MSSSAMGLMARSTGLKTTPADIFLPIVVGTLLGCFLYGMYILGLILHFSMIPKHHWGMVTFLVILTAVATVDTAVVCSRTVKLTATHTADLVYFLETHTRSEEWLHPLFSNLTAVLVQGFMAYRIITFARAMSSTFGKRTGLLFKLAVPVLVLGLLASIAASVVLPVYIGGIQNYLETFDFVANQKAAKFKLYTNIQLGTYLVYDLIQTTLMIFQLRAVRTGFSLSNAVLDSLTHIVVRSGMLLAACQVVQYITFYATDSAWADFPVLFVGKIYAITALALVALPRRVHLVALRKMDAEAGHVPTGLGVEVPIQPSPGHLPHVTVDSGRMLSAPAVNDRWSKSEEGLQINEYGFNGTASDSDVGSEVRGQTPSQHDLPYGGGKAGQQLQRRFNAQRNPNGDMVDLVCVSCSTPLSRSGERSTATTTLVGTPAAIVSKTPCSKVVEIPAETLEQADGERRSSQNRQEVGLGLGVGVDLVAGMVVPQPRATRSLEIHYRRDLDFSPRSSPIPGPAAATAIVPTAHRFSEVEASSESRDGMRQLGPPLRGVNGMRPTATEDGSMSFAAFLKMDEGEQNQVGQASGTSTPAIATPRISALRRASLWLGQ